MSDFKVMVPLDGSSLAEHSLVYLDALKGIGNVEASLIGVVDEPDVHKNEAHDETAGRETNLLLTYLRETAADLEKHTGLKPETKVLRGWPARCILEEAQAYAPDLMIISTHGRSGAMRWRFGSVADKVIRGAECDTLVVGPHVKEITSWREAKLTTPFKSVLLPIDGSGLAEQALDVARRFAQAFHSTVHIVRVVPIPTTAVGYGAEAAYIPDLLDQIVEGAQANVRDVSSHFGGVEVVTDVLIGAAETELESYVRQKDIDLVVMTSHGRGGLLRTALGSITDRMLASGSAPVLVVRPKDNPK